MIDYFQYELISKIQVINEKPAIFPGVTICNINPFSSMQSQMLIEKKFLQVYNVSIDSLNYTEMFNKLRRVSELTKMYANSPQYSDEQRKNLSMDFNLFVPRCRFNQKPCDKNDLNWVYLYDYGNCVQFNNNQINDTYKSTELEGIKYGLLLFIGAIRNENKYPNTISDGLRIFVHNQSFSPSSTEGLDIEIGKETTITIKRTFTSNVPYPYSECADTLNLDLIKNYKKYSNQKRILMKSHN